MNKEILSSSDNIVYLCIRYYPAVKVNNKHIQDIVCVMRSYDDAMEWLSKMVTQTSNTTYSDDKLVPAYRVVDVILDTVLSFTV